MAPELETLFRSAKLFSLPEVYLRVRETLDRPDYDVDEVARSISQDPSLTARLLRVVNSPFFGLVAQSDNVKRAITLLGPRQIHDLVLATVVTASFSRLDVSLVDMRRFWRNSVYCGVIARQLGSSWPGCCATSVTCSCTSRSRNCAPRPSNSSDRASARCSRSSAS